MVMHEFYIVTQSNMLRVIEQAFNDELPSAQMTFMGVAEAINAIEQRSKTDHPMRCICPGCDVRFSTEHKPVAFGVIVPLVREKDSCIAAHGICEQCFDRSDLKDQLLTALRTLFPKGHFRDVPRKKQ